MHPLPQDPSVQCHVLQHTRSCRGSLSWRKRQAEKWRTRQEKWNTGPSLHHFCFHSMIPSFAKSSLGSFHSFNHFVQHLGEIVWFLKDCLWMTCFYTCMSSQAFKRSTCFRWGKDNYHCKKTLILWHLHYNLLYWTWLWFANTSFFITHNYLFLNNLCSTNISFWAVLV